ncbi:flagellar basal body protein [Balneolaceae bacterium ANBcel3]|nr:flagellar basal body protein [Balneolaceae bacterium ANBcel3]
MKRIKHQKRTTDGIGKKRIGNRRKNGMAVAVAVTGKKNRRKLTLLAMKLIDNNHSQLMARTMDALTLRQRMTSANIANLDTPGFKKLEVRFEDELQRAQQSSGVRGMSEVHPTIVETNQAPVLEDELLEMSDTQIRVNVMARSLRHHFDMLRTGITGINR